MGRGKKKGLKKVRKGIERYVCCNSCTGEER